MMEGALKYVMSEIVDCIRTKTQNYVLQPEIKSLIVWCVMPVI